jgi:hypothetical protein
LLGGVALLCNVLATFIVCARPALADGALASIVICTASGAKSVPAEGDAGDKFAAGHCPACSVAQFVLAVTVAITAAPLPLAAADARAPCVSSQLPVHLSLGGIRSRAPPLSL